MPTTPALPDDVDGGPDAPVATSPSPDRPIGAGAGATRVVGIGASAGGLEAFEQFFSATPPDTGLAFVVVQHLDPTKTGMLPELLQRLTPMPVVEAEDGMPIEPNRVHVIPPNRSMTVEDGRLRLRELKAGTHIQMAVDVLFRSLAIDLKERAVAVVLSGMGTDGALGIGAIKEMLGLVLVQEPETAPYDGMPRSAVGTGLADYVAPAEELPALLLGHLERERSLPETDREGPPAETCARILALLRSRTGHDFSQYKATTIHRRILRRTAVHRLEHLADYLQHLQENPAEVDLLFHELLIGVTQYFRDPEAWDVLRDRVIPDILAQERGDGMFRAWIPGCSTGEEAYSLAIVILEALERAGNDRAITVQIFATDIDREAIAAARRGVYPANIAADVSEERRRRYFVREDDGAYRVRKEVRELLVFAEQDVVMDPPFTRLDLLSCRNLLIYFSPELQRKVVPLFHYSLLPGGYLFLGSSETTGSASPLFDTIDSKWKIYRRKGSRSEYPDRFDVPILRSAPGVPRAGRHPRSPESALADRLQALLLRDFAAPAVVVNERGDIVYVSGRTGRFLESPPGKAALNIFAMAREGLGPGLENALYRAFRDRTPVTIEGLSVGVNGGTVPLALTVRPLGDSGELRELMIVVFEEQPRPPPTGTAIGGPASPESAGCEEVLRQTRERLQNTIEEMEASREDLQSTNEEMQSTNEELQSTNEELTTSKEELQSLNEELVTVNQELQRKIEELSRSGNDIRNLLDATDIGTLFLDRELRIKRFTAPATSVIDLIPSDIGRPVGHIALHLRYDRLVQDARGVIEDLVPRERQVQATDGRWYIIRIRPYLTVKNMIEGAVITFTEITTVKQLELELEKSREWLVQAQRIGHLGSWRWDLASDQVTVSDEWYRIYGLPPYDDARPLADFAPLAFPGRDLREVIDRAATGTPVTFELTVTRPDGETRDLMSTIRANPGEAIGVILDVTDRKQVERALREAELRIGLAGEELELGLFQQDRALRYVWVLGPSIPGTPEPLVGRTDADFLPPPEAGRLATIKQGVIATGEPARTTTVRLHGGRTFVCDERYEPWHDVSGTVIGITGRVTAVPEGEDGTDR